MYAVFIGGGGLLGMLGGLVDLATLGAFGASGMIVGTISGAVAARLQGWLEAEKGKFPRMAAIPETDLPASGWYYFDRKQRDFFAERDMEEDPEEADQDDEQADVLSEGWYYWDPDVGEFLDEDDYETLYGQFQPEQDHSRQPEDEQHEDEQHEDELEEIELDEPVHRGRTESSSARPTKDHSLKPVPPGISSPVIR